MDALRVLFARFVESWRAASPRQRRTWTGVLAAALCLFALTSALVVALSRPGASTTPRHIARATATNTATDTATATNTATATSTPPPPTATPRPKPVATIPAPPPPPLPTPPPTPTAGPATPTATPCVPTYTGNNPTQTEIKQALDSAATTYNLPKNLLYAVAWQESRWHQDVTSCDGGIGLMQIQNYSYDFINNTATQSDCGLGPTTFDVHTLQGNAMLGAKYLVYLSCFFEYWGNNSTGGTSVSNPGYSTSAWYYQNAGRPYPDSSMPDSFCAANLNDAAQPWYKALPESSTDPWSCPYQPKTGDATLLDISLSAYNEGADNVVHNGITNWWYVQGVEGWIPQFAAGTLPS